MTAGQQPNPCTPAVIQGYAEHASLPTDNPIEDFREEDMATGSMAVGGRSPTKHPRAGSEEDSVDIAALLDCAADRFSACMDTKVDSMMDRLEKRIDEKIDSKLGFRGRNTHGLTEAQAWKIITELRQGIGPDLDSVRNTKIICYLKTPSLSSCKQIREAMNAFIEKENIKLGP